MPFPPIPSRPARRVSTPGGQTPRPGNCFSGQADSSRAIPLCRPSRGDTLAFGQQVNCDPEKPNPEQPHPRQSVVVHLSPHDFGPSSPAPEFAPGGIREAHAGGQPTGIGMDRGPPPRRDRPVGRSRFARMRRASGARHAGSSVKSGRTTSKRSPTAPYRATQSDRGVKATKAPKTLRKPMSCGIRPGGRRQLDRTPTSPRSRFVKPPRLMERRSGRQARFRHWI